MDQRLETFLTVCATMNYRKAAEQLHLTQPAVTKQIQALEALYGVRLFTYDSRKLRKTPQGETLEIYAISQRYQDEELRRARQDESNRHYAKSWLAIALPVIYCLLDALGTFADSRVLEKLGEELADACNVAYELTFLVMGIACAIYVLGIKKQRLIPKQEGPKYLGAVCETIGQFFYIYALADTEHVAFAAPIISSYCVASVIWGRIFLKEKLSKKHYACIALVVAGIVIMGILDI